MDTTLVPLVLPHFLTANKASLVKTRRDVIDAIEAAIMQMDNLAIASRQADYRPVFLTVHRKGNYGTQLRWRSTSLGHLNEASLIQVLRAEPKAIRDWSEQMNELATRLNCQEKALRNWSKELERSISLIEHSGQIMSVLSAANVKSINNTKVSR
jgi:hypothetical protein